MPSKSHATIPLSLFEYGLEFTKIFDNFGWKSMSMIPLHIGSAIKLSALTKVCIAVLENLIFISSRTLLMKNQSKKLFPKRG
jgi:hypothetical protein